MVTKQGFNPECITYSQMGLIFNSRIYYRRLTTWIRAYVLSRLLEIGTAEELFTRFYLETQEVGDMLQIIFGRIYSEQYGQYLAQFSIIFRDYIDAIIAGDEDAVNQSMERFNQNLEDRAAFLEALNPYWNAEEYKRLLGEYLQFIFDLTDSIVIAKETGDYSSDIEIYDRMNDQIRVLGDVFAAGLYDYLTSGAYNEESLPPPDSVQCIPYDQMNAIFTIRMFWYELVILTRNYMLARYRGLGNADEAEARLRQAPDEYIALLQQIFGDEYAEAYRQLFITYFDLIEGFITAQMEGNIDELNEITQLLYQNAADRAAFAALNPFWDVKEWERRLNNNVRATIDESTTFLTRDYARNIDIFSRLLDQAEDTSNYFAQGLFDYINFNR